MTMVFWFMGGIGFSLVIFNFLPMYRNQRKEKKNILEEKRREYREYYEKTEDIRLKLCLPSIKEGGDKTMVRLVSVVIDNFDYRECKNTRVFEKKNKLIKMQLSHLQLLEEKIEKT